MVSAPQFVIQLRALFDAQKHRTLEESRAGAQGLWTLAGVGSWALYLKSDLDLDTDGPRAPGVAYESTHQDETSLRWPGGASISSNDIPFVVIPGGWDRGIALGDVCLVQYCERITPAIVADFGPRSKVGEGSIALHRALGFERIKGGRIIDVGIEGEVRTVFFPSTGEGHCLPIEDIAARAWSAWAALVGEE